MASAMLEIASSRKRNKSFADTLDMLFVENSCKFENVLPGMSRYRPDTNSLLQESNPNILGLYRDNEKKWKLLHYDRVYIGIVVVNTVI